MIDGGFQNLVLLGKFPLVLMGFVLWMASTVAGRVLGWSWLIMVMEVRMARLVVDDIALVACAFSDVRIVGSGRVWH